MRHELSPVTAGAIRLVYALATEHAFALGELLAGEHGKVEEVESGKTLLCLLNIGVGL